MNAQSVNTVKMDGYCVRAKEPEPKVVQLQNGALKMKTEDRFMNMVAHCPSGCWMWAGSKDRTGYGIFSMGRKNKHIPAHRWSYEHFIKNPISGLEAHHTCGIKGCVSPHHLEFLTRSEHLRRHNRNLADRDRCHAGHEFTEENTRIRTQGKNTFRVCIMCDRIHSYEKRQRRKRTASEGEVK